MSYTKKRQAVEHIESSKAPDTRRRRIEKLIQELARPIDAAMNSRHQAGHIS